MTQANQNQNILDHPQGNTHNDYQTHTRKRSNPQSTSTSDNTTRTNTNTFSSASYFLKASIQTSEHATIYYNYRTSINFKSI